MLNIEHQFEEYLGEFSVEMTCLLGFSRLKAGDKYEVALRYGKGQKWKSNGQIVKKGYQLEQKWSETKTDFRPLIGESIAIRVSEGRKIGKAVVVGFAQCETKGNVNHKYMYFVFVMLQETLGATLVKIYLFPRSKNWRLT